MSESTSEMPGSHQDQPALIAGAPLEQARAAMIMTHGRGASAEDILALATELTAPAIAYLAPRAAGNSWYPNSFLAPIASNEPDLSSALTVLVSLLAHLRDAGIPPERTMLLGFSQGACLMLEFVARHPACYGSVVGLSGGLIGPDETPRDYPGSLENTPVFLGCSDVDPHIPKERVELTADVLRRMGGQVTMRLYSDMEHTVNRDEIRRVQEMINALRL